MRLQNTAEIHVPLLVSTDHSSIKGSTNSITSPNNPGKSISLEEYDTLYRGSLFALAAYSHLIYLYMKPCSGLCRLSCYKGITSCLCFNKQQDYPVIGDSYYRLHTAGIENISKYLKNTSIIFASFKNDTTHKPFIVFLDHEKKWLVIAIRGTLSLEDCLTDANCEPMEVSLSLSVYV